MQTGGEESSALGKVRRDPNILLGRNLQQSCNHVLPSLLPAIEKIMQVLSWRTPKMGPSFCSFRTCLKNKTPNQLIKVWKMVTKNTREGPKASSKQGIEVIARAGNLRDHSYLSPAGLRHQKVFVTSLAIMSQSRWRGRQWKTNKQQSQRHQWMIAWSWGRERLPKHQCLLAKEHKAKPSRPTQPSIKNFYPFLQSDDVHWLMFLQLYW